MYRWSAKLRGDHTIFQAELIALKVAVQRASHINNNFPILIHVDNQASLQASINPKSSNKIARIITKTLREYPNIFLAWIKAHTGYEGSEEADMFDKQATLNMFSTSRLRTSLVPHQGPFQEINDEELEK
ncbi:hypothetical protein AVEN_162182-1 [Araneus ventricosus]|uniref:RNase H type-1 domain-containing protein n=1 Tax=Araneus ventricosus TaxID=182803 RepID=A0A4Y2H106_ARAVE|nr:hypothetical protein AVEN_162182-1 [Araneus ventricosus]